MSRPRTGRYHSRSFADKQAATTRRTEHVAGKKERQRKLARERHLRQQTRRARRARRAQFWSAISVACIVIVGLGVGGYFLFKPGGTNAAATSATATPTPTASATPTPTASAVAEPATHCTYTSSPPAARSVGMPPATPASTATYQATITTNRGDVVIDLLNSKATCTVNSFVYLAAKNYFNNTKCHRLTTSGSLFVLQCGDPAGTGRVPALQHEEAAGGGQPVALGVVEVVFRRQVHERVDRAGRLAVQQVDHDITAVGGDGRLISGGGRGRGRRHAHAARRGRAGGVGAVRGRLRNRASRRCRRRAGRWRGRGGRRGGGGVGPARLEQEVPAHAEPDDHDARHADRRPELRPSRPPGAPGLLAQVTLTG